jgi:hypothetical protein
MRFNAVSHISYQGGLFSEKNLIAKKQIPQATAKMNENYTIYSTFYAEPKYAVRISLICTQACVINGKRYFTSARSAVGVFTPIRTVKSIDMRGGPFPYAGKNLALH